MREDVLKDSHFPTAQPSYTKPTEAVLGSN
jgi:hypothetical protein